MSESIETPARAREVVRYWRQAGAGRWFAKNDAFDADFSQHFEADHDVAAAGRHGDWTASAEGALALLILLDQFPRNAFRESPRMFATDVLAREVARSAIDGGLDRRVVPGLQPFFYLPLMHSESLADQQRSVDLNRRLDENTQRFARMHLDIIERFGRFPHRNAVLGRESTGEEQTFLADGGFKG